MAYRGRQSRQKQADGKYLRLTGLWQNKHKDNLWTGKLKAEHIELFIQKANEALDARMELVMFLWENKTDGPKDPDFTLQVTVAEEEVRSSRGRSSYSRQDRTEVRDEARQEARPARTAVRRAPVQVAADEDDLPVELPVEEAPEEVQDVQERPRRAKFAPVKTEPAPRQPDKDDW